MQWSNPLDLTVIVRVTGDRALDGTAEITRPGLSPSAIGAEGRQSVFSMDTRPAGESFTVLYRTRPTSTFDQLSSITNKIEQAWSSPHRFRHVFFDSVAGTTPDSTGRSALSG